jgi:hypothetical protein
MRVNNKQWLARRVAIKLVLNYGRNQIFTCKFFCFINYGMDTLKTSGNQLHGYLKD